MKSQLKRLLREDGGQALAEMALTLPVLLLLIAGILEFGRAYHIQQIVTDAAREGARLAVVNDGSAETIGDVKDRVKARLVVTAVDTALADVRVEEEADFRVTGEAISVVVVVPYRMGFVGALLNWAGSDISLGSRTTMRNE